MLKFLLMVPMFMLSSAFAQNAMEVVHKGAPAFERFFNSGDVSSLVRMYDENAKVMPPEGDARIGRPAIEAYWVDKLQNMQNLRLKPESADFLSPDHILVTGQISMESRHQTPVKYEGKYAVVLKKQEKGWAIAMDIFNLNNPAK